jgi:hypothetical protein
MDVSSNFHSSFALFRAFLFETAAPLQNLDFVSVRVLDEEKPCEQPAVLVEFDDVAW